MFERDPSDRDSSKNDAHLGVRPARAAHAGVGCGKMGVWWETVVGGGALAGGENAAFPLTALSPLTRGAKILLRQDPSECDAAEGVAAGGSVRGKAVVGGEPCVEASTPPPKAGLGIEEEEAGL